MKQITKKQFLADVRHEIEMLKLHATDKEKRNLDFDTFRPEYENSCIYGQMTGQCYSSRAKDLMDLSCVRMFDKNPSGKGNISKIISCVNGKYVSNCIWMGNAERDFNYDYISSLEGYIFASDAKNAEIIAYIKGETETLEL